MSGSRVTHSEAWWAGAPSTTIRCVGHYKGTGEQCRREAVGGANVCTHHGGLAPQVVAAAMVRVQMTADAAAEQLVQWMNDPAVDMRERVKIAQDLLGRAGVSGVDKMLIGLKVDPVEDLFRRLLGADDALAPAVTSPRKALPPVDYGQAEPASSAADIDDAPVDAVIVAEEPPTRQRGTRPPKHIREALARLI